MGSGPFALPTLDILARPDAKHTLAAVVTRPDRPGRRGRKLLPTPVRARAAELGIECRAPESINDPAVVDELRSLDADLFLVADFGQILRDDVIGAPRIGTFNLHASILPLYRGAAPVAYALLAGETRTGVTLFRVERGLDSGPIVATTEVDVDPEETTGELEARLAIDAAGLLERALDAFADGSFTETIQDHDAATRAPKLTKEGGRLDFDAEAAVVRDRVRALNPWPIASAWLLREGREAQRTAFLRVRTLDSDSAAPCDADSAHSAPPGTVVEVTKKGFVVACRNGCVRIVELQRPGKPAMAAAAWINGNPIAVGDRFVPSLEEVES